MSYCISAYVIIANQFIPDLISAEAQRYHAEFFITSWPCDNKKEKKVLTAAFDLILFLKIVYDAH